MFFSQLKTKSNTIFLKCWKEKNCHTESNMSKKVQKWFSGEKIILEQFDHYLWDRQSRERQRGILELSLSLTPYTKSNTIWIMDINVKCVTIKLSKENIGGKSSWRWVSQWISKPKACRQQQEKNRWTELKNFHVSNALLRV